MLITLYTSRIILKNLGVIDFGIYNVVGGVVVMFSFLNSAMASGTQRFLSYDLGKLDYKQLKKTFNMLLTIHFFIAMFIFVLAETIGLWFIYSKLNIPSERFDAACWVYQFSILTFMVTVTQVPYNACIIAHEKMDVFAYLSIFDVCLKLLIVFLLNCIVYDKLKLYALLFFLSSTIIAFLYRLYCLKKFEECSYKFEWDHNLFMRIFSFSGWSMLGSGFALVVANQGINILLNVFFGPVVNTARGIANQINSAVMAFVANFQTAMNPQIVKLYANDELDNMKSLVFKGSKYSFFLLYLLALPVLLNIREILLLWLGEVPDFTIVFTKLILLTALIDCLSGPFVIAIQATGKIKMYQVTVGSLLLLNLPISLLLVYFLEIPEIVLYVSLGLSVILLFIRLIYFNRITNGTLEVYIKTVLFRVFAVTIIPFILVLHFQGIIANGLEQLFIVSVVSFVATLFSIYFIGLNSKERQFVNTKMKTLFYDRAH